MSASTRQGHFAPIAMKSAEIDAIHTTSTSHGLDMLVVYIWIYDINV
jgi:hypothetical protein